MVSNEPEGTTIALRNKRSRRVSFATKIVTSVHEFDRDEEDYEPPPHRPTCSSVVKDEFLLFFEAMGVDPDDDSYDLPSNAEELDGNADKHDDDDADKLRSGTISDGSEFVEKGDVVKVNEGGNARACVDEISGSGVKCLNGGECVISGLVNSKIDIEAQMQVCDSESRFTERSFIVEGKSREMRMEGADLVQMTGLSLLGDRRGLEVEKNMENDGKIDNKLVVLNETVSVAKAEEDSCITCKEENQNDVEEEAPPINRVSKSSDSDKSKDYELPTAIMAECKGEHGSQTRERRRSTYLSPSYYYTDRILKSSKDVFKIPKVSSGRKFNRKPCQNPIYYSNILDVINISSNESLSQLQMAAIDSHHPNLTIFFDSMKVFFSMFRIFLSHDDFYIGISSKNTIQQSESAAADHKTDVVRKVEIDKTVSDSSVADLKIDSPGLSSPKDKAEPKRRNNKRKVIVGKSEPRKRNRVMGPKLVSNTDTDSAEIVKWNNVKPISLVKDLFIDPVLKNNENKSDASVSNDTDLCTERRNVDGSIFGSNTDSAAKAHEDLFSTCGEEDDNTGKLSEAYVNDVEEGEEEKDDGAPPIDQVFKSSKRKSCKTHVESDSDECRDYEVASTTLIEGKGEQSCQTREGKRSKYLSFPYHTGSFLECIVEADSKFSKVSNGRKFDRKPFKNPVDSSNNSAVINISSHESLFQLQRAAMDCRYASETKIFDSMKVFFSMFRKYLFYDESNIEISSKITIQQRDVIRSSVADHKTGSSDLSPPKKTPQRTDVQNLNQNVVERVFQRKDIPNPKPGRKKRVTEQNAVINHQNNTSDRTNLNENNALQVPLGHEAEPVSLGNEAEPILLGNKAEPFLLKTETKQGSQTREQKRSMYLSHPYNTDNFLKFIEEDSKIPEHFRECKEEADSKTSKVSSIRKFNRKPCKTPVDSSNNSEIIYISSLESLSQLRMAAINSLYPNETNSFISVKVFFTMFRNSLIHGESYIEISDKITVLQKDVIESSVADHKIGSFDFSSPKEKPGCTAVQTLNQNVVEPIFHGNDAPKAKPRSKKGVAKQNAVISCQSITSDRTNLNGNEAESVSLGNEAEPISLGNEAEPVSLGNEAEPISQGTEAEPFLLKNEAKQGLQTRERKRSMYLSPPFYTDCYLKFIKENSKIPEHLQECIEEADSKILKVSSGRKFNRKRCKNPVDSSNNSKVINMSSHELLSQLQMAAIDSYSFRKSFESIKIFFPTFRKSVFRDQSSNIGTFSKNTIQQIDDLGSSVARGAGARSCGVSAAAAWCGGGSGSVGGNGAQGDKNVS